MPAVKITARIDALRINERGRETLVLRRPRANNVVVREHVNVEVAALERAHVTAPNGRGFRVGDHVLVSCVLDEYEHNGATKTCLRDISSFRFIP
jgi:hypothetical protein